MHGAKRLILVLSATASSCSRLRYYRNYISTIRTLSKGGMALPPGRKVLTPAQKKQYNDAFTPLSDDNRPDAEPCESDTGELPSQAPVVLPDPRLISAPVDTPWTFTPVSNVGQNELSVYQARRTPNSGRVTPLSIPNTNIASASWTSATVPAGTPVQSQPQPMTRLGSPHAAHYVQPPIFAAPQQYSVITTAPASLPLQYSAIPTAPVSLSQSQSPATMFGCIPTPLQHDDSLRRLASMLLDSLRQPPPTLPAPAAQATIVDLSPPAPMAQATTIDLASLGPPPLSGPHPVLSLG
jgi:hypothetical protein